MSSPYARLDQGVTEALKGQHAVALSTLRMLKSAIRHREVEVKRTLTEAELVSVIASQVKQRREAMGEDTKAGRPDLAHQEEEELSILLFFLPPQASVEQGKAKVSKIIKEFDTSGPRDLGKVMKLAMARLAGQADGTVVQEIARRLLGS